MPVPKRYAEAFKEGYNVIGLAAAAAVSCALLNPLPLLGALVAETAYMMFVPDTKWYADRLDRKYDDEVKERREELKAKILPGVPDGIRSRFYRLESARVQIEAQTRGEDLKWFRVALRKLDYLLEMYLKFAQKQGQFCTYLDSVANEVRNDEGFAGEAAPPVMSKKKLRDRVPAFEIQDGPQPLEPTEKWVEWTVNSISNHYGHEIDDIQEKLSQNPDVPTLRVMEKRKDVLGRRKEYVGRIGQILTNLGHQMELMSDAFGLINDEMRARSPEQVLADIDEVVTTTNSLTEAIEEVAPLEELVAKM